MVRYPPGAIKQLTSPHLQRHQHAVGKISKKRQASFMSISSLNSSPQDILPHRAETVLSAPFKTTTREASIRKAKGISTPHHNDVLMGRGGKNNQHSGNETLRGFARLHSQAYSCASKKEKSDISRELVRLMRELEPSARFLKYDADTNKWEDVGDEVAREKTSQVLRDAAKSKKTFAVDGNENIPLADEPPSPRRDESSSPPQEAYDRFYLSPAEHYPEVYSENHHYYGYSHGHVSSHYEYYASTAPRNPSVTPVSSTYDPRKKVRTSESPLTSMNYQAPRVPHFSESASKGTYLSPRRTSRFYRPSPGYHNIYSSQSATVYDPYPRSPASAVIPAHYAVHARGGARNEPWMADINAQLFDVRSPVAKHGGRDLYQEDLLTDHSDHREGAISPFIYPSYDHL